MTIKRNYLTEGERKRLLAIAKKYGLDGEPRAQPQPYPKARVNEKTKEEWRRYADQNDTEKG